VAEIGVREAVLSDLHGHALPLYTSFGLDAWWPLLYLRGRVDALPAPDGWQVEPATPVEVAALELAWTGVDRADDHFAWSRRPGSGLPARAAPGRPGAARGGLAGGGV
jgi:hypothetical protein